MNIAITAPAGHVGSAVVDFLLDFGDEIEVRLLGRRPEKLKNFTERGAQVFVGLQDDADYLTKATRDVDALFWVTPPGYGSDNVRAFQNRLGKAGATAIRANNIPRVVVLSSLGANLNSGVGPISGLHDVEELLGDVAANITFLRPGFFFENLLWQLDSMKNRGQMSLPLSGSRQYPMIATRDIGRVAAGACPIRNGPGAMSANSTDRPICRSTRWPESFPIPSDQRSSTSSVRGKRRGSTCSTAPLAKTPPT